MSMFNKTVVDALLSGDYICSQCSSKMEFEDEFQNFLVCPKCGHSIDYDRYGFESDEEYDALYPTKEEVLGYDQYESDDDEEDEEDEEDTGERYEEVYGELSDD